MNLLIISVTILLLANVQAAPPQPPTQPQPQQPPQAQTEPQPQEYEYYDDPDNATVTGKPIQGQDVDQTGQQGQGEVKVPKPDQPDVQPVQQGDKRPPVQVSANQTKPADTTEASEATVLWESGIVYYTIESSHYDDNELAMIRESMNIIERRTCIQFSELEGEVPKDYIIIKKDEGCHSLIGRTGGEQLVSLGKGCMIKINIVHELLHALGLYHEHNRPDRDDWIKVNWDNIIKDEYTNFEIAPEALTARDFDYSSIMLYEPDAFAKEDGTVTIESRIDGQRILAKKEKRVISDGDVFNVNYLYGCDVEPPEDNKDIEEYAE